MSGVGKLDCFMVWDLPTRLFHWGLAISIVGAYISGENGWQKIHELCGLTVFGLIVFRLIWGVIGHPTARFTNLIHPPKAIFHYLKNFLARRKTHFIGHNPLGGMAALFMIALMGGMAITGLWNSDDILYEGPMLRLAPEALAKWAGFLGRWHIVLHFLVLPVIALHLLAVLTHRLWLGEKLVSRMIIGGKETALPKPQHTTIGLALLVLCVGAAHSLAWFVPAIF